MSSTPAHAFASGEARRAGATRRFVDAPQWDRPFHGVRMPRTSPDALAHPATQREQRLLARADGYRTVMGSDAFFSHTTAALLWGLPLPPLSDDDIHVAVLAPSRAPAGRGVRGHQLHPRGIRVVESETGVRLADPATTWSLLGSRLRHPYDLVAVGDAIVSPVRIAGPHGGVVRDALASIEDLGRVVEAVCKRRGIIAVREALPRVRSGVRSRTETWTRLTLVDGGLPEPVLNHDVYDGAGFVACIDLAYPDQRVGVEYEGDQHRTDPAQWQRDLERYERLAAAGWRTVRVTRDVLFQRPGLLVRLVADACASRHR
ncbi:hypothetical protein QE392_003134 [Microbacterium proteolyticum]|nr:hypothetical protein [Microbacterium sp. SORGH_AS_0344]MDQ1171330.1 hypothetical protein [Microbacterium proteolyticum]